MYKQIPDNHYHTSKIISHHALYFLRKANIPNKLFTGADIPTQLSLFRHAVACKNFPPLCWGMGVSKDGGGTVGSQADIWIFGNFLKSS